MKTLSRTTTDETKSSRDAGVNVADLPSKDERGRATLPQVKEEDADEALKIVGETRTEFSEAAYDAVLRKVDKRVPPLLAAVYFLQFLDKTSLNYSSIMGLPIEGQAYNLCSLSFYLGYLVWEWPTQLLAQRFPMAKYLGMNIVIWGGVLLCHAAAPRFGPFFALRFLLGMLESCVSPILITIVASWYRKNEQARRISWFYVMNGLTEIFGGLLAFAITFYKGNGIAHWRIIYIILGAISLLVGMVVLIYLPDSPATAKFLTEEERIIAIERVRDNQTGTSNKTWKKEQFLEALKDPRSWLIVLATLLSSIPNGGLSAFTSKIIKSFGYTSRISLLLNVPKGAIAAATTLSLGYWSDKAGERMLPILASVGPTILGCAMLVGFDADREKFKVGCIIGMFLTATYGSGLSILYSWNASNIGGSTKRSTLNVLLMISFAAGNCVGGEIFLPQDAPGYIPGKIACLVLFSALAVVALLLRWVNLVFNKRKATALAEAIRVNGWTEEDVRQERDKAAFLDLTDGKNIFFVYMP